MNLTERTARRILDIMVSSGEAAPLTGVPPQRTLVDLLRAVNRTLRGWCAYYRHGVPARTFSYLDHFVMAAYPWLIPKATCRSESANSATTRSPGLGDLRRPG